MCAFVRTKEDTKKKGQNTGDLSRVHPTSRLMTDGIGTIPRDHEWIKWYRNGWHEQH